MKAESNGTAPEAGVRYIECDWGDLIEGSKEQLQALGLGIGLAYPGEVGGPRLDLKVRDPRGYLVRISNSWHHDGRFTAYLGFPHWPERPKAAFLATVVRGVKKREFIWADEYVGCAAALAAAGLVRVDQLPGMPGMGKVSVTIYPTAPPRPVARRQGIEVGGRLAPEWFAASQNRCSKCR